MNAKKPLFLLGAGFNVDAAAAVSPGSAVGYPLVGDLWDCFPSGERQRHPSVEQAFHAWIKRNDWGPVSNMDRRINVAEQALLNRLFPFDRRGDDAYNQFFDKFVDSDFLTFNYDGLVEVALLRRNSWTPKSGFGCEVAFTPVRNQPKAPPLARAAHVIHLHGSRYLRTQEFIRRQEAPDGLQEIRLRDRPRYEFDPRGAGGSFGPYGALPGRVRDIDERIIIPTPFKDRMPVHPYAKFAYKKATELAQKAGPLVAIGYSFSRHDLDSYALILNACMEGSKRLVIVDPCAPEAKLRVESACPELQIDSYRGGFADWVCAGYPGAQD